MRINKSIVNRYEEQSILSCIELLAKHDNKNRLIFNLFDSPLTVKFDNIKRQLQESLRFKLYSKHYETIKQAFDKYNISIVFPKRISKKRKENEKVLMADHDVNHYQGNNIHVPR